MPFAQCFTSSLTMPSGQLCMCCPRPAEFRCRDCSAIAYYCEDCCRSQHRWCNILHVPEKWVSDHYSIAPLYGLVIPITHECPSTYREHITVVSLRGKKSWRAVLFLISKIDTIPHVKTNNQYSCAHSPDFVLVYTCRSTSCDFSGVLWMQVSS